MFSLLFVTCLLALFDCPNVTGEFQVYQWPSTGLQPLAANVAEFLQPGFHKTLDANSHGANHLNNFSRKRKRVEEEEDNAPLPKIILVTWDRNGEILDDPHVLLRRVDEDNAISMQSTDKMPPAKMSPLIECNSDLDKNCDYDLFIGSGVVDITLRKDRETRRNPTGKIEISYAEREGGQRISYIESIERLSVAADPGHGSHQEHHQIDMSGPTNITHNNILHLKYHPFDAYSHVYHIHGIVFWHGKDIERADPMPITAHEPFVHIEYFSDHEHVMSKLPYEMDHDPETGEFRITIRNGFGLNEYRKAEDPNYGKINIAVAVNKKLFQMSYYRVYTINVNECIQNSQQHANGEQHKEYSKENPAQILYLWADTEKKRFGTFPLKVNTHSFRIQIMRHGQGECAKPFMQNMNPQNWLEFVDEDKGETLTGATNVHRENDNLLSIHVNLQPNIAEGLFVRIDCGDQASINKITYKLESFEQLKNVAQMQLQPETTASQPGIQVSMIPEGHHVHHGARDLNRKMQHRFKNNGHEHPELRESGNGKQAGAMNQQPSLRDDRCGPGIPKERVAEECKSYLHQGKMDRLPSHALEHAPGGMPTNSAGQSVPMAGQFGQPPPMTGGMGGGQFDQNGMMMNGGGGHHPPGALDPYQINQPQSMLPGSLPSNRIIPMDGSLLHHPPPGHPIGQIPASMIGLANPSPPTVVGQTMPQNQQYNPAMPPPSDGHIQLPPHIQMPPNPMAPNLPTAVNPQHSAPPSSPWQPEPTLQHSPAGETTDGNSLPPGVLSDPAVNSLVHRWWNEHDRALMSANERTYLQMLDGIVQQHAPADQKKSLMEMGKEDMVAMAQIANQIYVEGIHQQRAHPPAASPSNGPPQQHISQGTVPSGQPSQYGAVPPHEIANGQVPPPHLQQHNNGGQMAPPHQPVQMPTMNEGPGMNVQGGQTSSPGFHPNQVQHHAMPPPHAVHQLGEHNSAPPPNHPPPPTQHHQSHQHPMPSAGGAPPQMMTGGHGGMHPYGHVGGGMFPGHMNHLVAPVH